MARGADVSENLMLLSYGEDVCNTLLKDQTTQQNIYWATDSYAHLDSYCSDDKPSRFQFLDQLTLDTITSYVSPDGKVISKNEYDELKRNSEEEAFLYSEIIRPRAVKSKEEQAKRVKDKAEVFTPAWVCNMQNNLIDEAWFGRCDGLFNVSDPDDSQKWVNNESKIDFKGTGKIWKDYVSDMRLEITCGEAPYLCNRYDAVTGDYNKDVKHRIGLLDRKLRIVTENVANPEKWCVWALIALRSIYGFEWQGDNLLLAREAMLFTVIEHFFVRFSVKQFEEVKDKLVPQAAYIISWNVWQMDGLKYGLPGYEPHIEDDPNQAVQLSIAFDFTEDTPKEREVQPLERLCTIKNFFNDKNLKKRNLDFDDFDDEQAPVQTFRSLVSK